MLVSLEICSGIYFHKSELIGKLLRKKVFFLVNIWRLLFLHIINTWKIFEEKNHHDIRLDSHYLSIVFLKSATFQYQKLFVSKYNMAPFYFLHETAPPNNCI